MDEINEIIEAMDEHLQTDFEMCFPDGEPDPNNDEDVAKMERYVQGLTQMDMRGNDVSYLDLYLYRARYDEGFDRTEISQFGYKPDAIRNLIGRLRYNLPAEQVLYTSTNPLTAFKEIEDATKDYEYFYLSVWTKKVDSQTPVLYPVLPNNPSQLKGYALDYYKSLEGHITGMPLTYHWQSRLGGCMEASCNGGINNGYLLSSTIAHRLFRENDVLLTVSQKSDNSELNITYKDTAYDFVELNTVFHCKCPAVGSSVLVFEVDKIGIINNGFVEWHKYMIDIGSICYIKRDAIHLQMAQLAKKILGATKKTCQQLK